jgi:acyl dehydratase
VLSTTRLNGCLTRVRDGRNWDAAAVESARLHHDHDVKMGFVGLAQTLALEGAKQNILVNVIAPIAGSRMTETVLPPDLIAALKPEFVSPLVQYLVHDTNKQNGAIYEVGAGWISRVRYERSAGVFFPLQSFKVEDVASKIQNIGDFTKDASYPTSPRDAFPAIMENIEHSKNAAPAPAASGSKGKAPAGKNPNVDLAKALAHKMDSLTHTYTERDTALYALGIGAAADPLDKSELKFVYELHEDFQVLPTFGVVIPSAALAAATTVPGLNFNPMMLLHGEQYMVLRKPLPSNATLTSFPRIAALYDKGSGALMVLEVSTRDSKGEEVLFNQYSLFIRGLGGFGGEKGPASESNDPPKGVAPEVVHREKTLDNQALLYRLSGDLNPLHADPDMAKTGNFPAPILHGLCSFGYASRAVIKHFANNDGRRFKSIRVRFVAPIYPGETLVTEMWRTSPNKIAFRTRVAERGIYAISNAVIELHPDPSVAVAAAPTAASTASTGFAAEGVFGQLAAASTPELVKKINATFKFDVSKDGQTHSWLLDLKNGNGSAARLRIVEVAMARVTAASAIPGRTDWMEQHHASPCGSRFRSRLEVRGATL